MATFGTKYSDPPGPSVYKIAGGVSHAPRGAGRTGTLKATPAQCRFLISLGYQNDPRELNRLEASDNIVLLKRRRKKRT